MTYGDYGNDGYGSSLYGSGYPPFGVESVTPLTNTLVRVRFTALIDTSYPAFLTVLNYSIFPALDIFTVILESAQTVLIVTGPQAASVYTLTVGDAQGYFGQPLDPALDQGNFTGLSALPSFFAVATRNNRIRVVFSEPVLQNAALTDPGEYLLTDLSGNSVTIDTVEAEQTSDVRSTVITTTDTLVDERHYRVTLLGGIVSVAEGIAPSPDTSVFQWNENVLRTKIPVSRFSGEVQNGLYGIHGGLVFFSPALVSSAANSVIEVDSVDVCTKAYDSYALPQASDPLTPIYTHGAGVVPTVSETTFNNAGMVLWAPFPRLVTATLSLTDTHEDTFVPPVDGPCDATLQEAWDLAYVSLLNAPEWKLFDNAGEPPTYFKTADNLAPIPAGGTTVINLQP